MNDRIEELISAYLMNGLTPDEEKELFSACAQNPTVAEALRRQMLLSLKLRALRDRTEVPRELHNALLEKINLAEAEVSHAAPSRLRPSFLPRFTWKHLTGASLASALGAALLFTLFSGTPNLPTDPRIIVRSDTVLVERTDTLVRIQRVNVPVNLAETRSQAADPLPTLVAEPIPVSTDDGGPALAEALTPEQEKRQPVSSSYLEQYTTMVISLEKTPITTQHRVRN